MNFRYKLMQFLSGRYGIDRMFYLLFGISVVLAFVNCFLKLLALQLICYAVVVYAFFRVLSKNIQVRSAENRAVMGVFDGIVRKFKVARQRRADISHIYKKCPKCKAVLRLPRRKGKHSTVCPKCNNQFTVRVYKEIK
ncbi:MAG: hypothetical protein MJ076_02500 [Clostridia bacterium]|nr:hypothetical protein [Clostridia bacterium]